MALEPIEKLVETHQVLRDVVSASGDISLLVSIDDQFRKTLLLSIASRFEVELKRVIEGVALSRLHGRDPLLWLLRNRAIERQYHTLFKWEARNANVFFGLFGQECREHLTALVKVDEGVASSISAFLEIGDLRNRLVHEDYASFPLEKTSDEIFELYKSARVFLQWLPTALTSFQTE